MSSISDENSSKRGHSITYETIAKGQIRTKVKFWVDDLSIEFGAKRAAELYEYALKEMKAKGFKLEGDV